MPNGGLRQEAEPSPEKQARPHCETGLFHCITGSAGVTGAVHQDESIVRYSRIFSRSFRTVTVLSLLNLPLAKAWFDFTVRPFQSRTVVSASFEILYFAGPVTPSNIVRGTASMSCFFASSVSFVSSSSGSLVSRTTNDRSCFSLFFSTASSSFLTRPARSSEIARVKITATGRCPYFHL